MVYCMLYMIQQLSYLHFEHNPHVLLYISSSNFKVIWSAQPEDQSLLSEGFSIILRPKEDVTSFLCSVTAVMLPKRRLQIYTLNKHGTTCIHVLSASAESFAYVLISARGDDRFSVWEYKPPPLHPPPSLAVCLLSATAKASPLT